MNRTVLASIVLGLALISLLVAWHGAGLRKEALQAREEWLELERQVDQKAAKAAQAATRASEEKDRSAQRLALGYRLKKLSGKRAQAEATGASAPALQALDLEIAALEEELRRLASPQSP